MRMTMGLTLRRTARRINRLNGARMLILSGYSAQPDSQTPDFLALSPITGGPTALGFDSYFGTDVPNYPPYCFIENERTVGIPSVPKPKSMYGTDGIMLPGWRLDAILPRAGGAGLRVRAALGRGE